MYSYYDQAPAQIKEAELARINKETALGVYDPLPEIRSNIEHQAREERRNLITIGLTTGFLGSIGLGTAFSLTAPLIGVIAGGCLVVFAGKGIAKYAQVKKDLRHDEFAPYLSDEELEDLDDFQRTFKPANDDAKQVHSLVKRICDELLEDDKDVETVDAKATEIKDATPPVKDDENGTPQKEELPPRKPIDVVAKPGLDQEDYVRPSVWLDSPAPEPIEDSLGAPIGMGKKIAELQEKQTEDFVFLAKDLAQTQKDLTEIKQMISSLQATGQQGDRQPDRNAARFSGPDLESFGTSVVQDSGQTSGKVLDPVLEPVIENNISLYLDAPGEFQPSVDIAGWTIDKFREEVTPGIMTPDQVVGSTTQKEKAVKLVYECQNKYGRMSPEYAAWYVFGQKRSGGCKKYKAIASFCKQCIEHWRINVRDKQIKPRLYGAA